jgi:hypothetical protein
MPLEDFGCYRAGAAGLLWQRDRSAAARRRMIFLRKTMVLRYVVNISSMTALQLSTLLKI